MELTRIKLITIVTEINQEEKYMKALEKYNVTNYILTRGLGTASPSLMDYFGLDEIKKEIILAIIPAYWEYDICNELNKILRLPGAGIAFTVPITASNKFLQDEFIPTKEWKKMKESNKSLIFTVINEGYFEEVMSSAKKAGATGGTLLRGRGLQTKEAEKFLGISIAPEKDIILIVVENELKLKVMESINEKVGLNTAGQGICFSVPIDAAIGFRD